MAPKDVLVHEAYDCVMVWQKGIKAADGYNAVWKENQNGVAIAKRVL